MPPFRRRNTSETEPPETAPAPEPETPSATERLSALLSEQAEIHATLDQHRARHAELLLEDNGLAAILAMRGEDAAAALRLEQIGARMPDLERELQRERREAWDAAWATHVPVLAEAEAALAEAIQTFKAALEHANRVYGAAAGFGERLREFVRPPPLQSYNDWALNEYLKVINRRQGTEQAPSSMVEITVPDRAPWRPRFVPRKVPRHLIEEVNPLESRKVRVLHDVNVTNLNFGHRKLLAGDEMEVPGPAAFVLTYAGVAAYIDGETVEAEPATA